MRHSSSVASWNTNPRLALAAAEKGVQIVYEELGVARAGVPAPQSGH